MTVRQDYIYPTNQNLPCSLMEVVDICVSTILKNCTQVYLLLSRKINKPLLRRELENTTDKKKIVVVGEGGNRIHVNKNI